jgi:hypothetical protein
LKPKSDHAENDPLNACRALTLIRSLYEVETDARKQAPQPLRGDELTAYRQQRAGPVLRAFADWLAEQVPKALPKCKTGEALVYAANQWPTLTRYVEDRRLTIDNAPAEQAIRPLAVGRRNWLHIAGDGGLKNAAVLLSVAASANRHQVNPWTYVKHLLTRLPARAPDAYLTHLLPDLWMRPDNRYAAESVA